MKPESTEQYLAEIRRRLWWLGISDPRILEEIESHLAEAVEAGLKQGLSAAEAQSQALKRFGPARRIASQFEKERMTPMQIALLVAAAAGGLFFAYMDSLPKFDDMGILVFGILLLSGLLALLGFRKPWLLAPAVGLWIPLHDILSSGNFGSLLALVIALAGAYGGYGLNWLLRKTWRAV